MSETNVAKPLSPEWIERMERQWRYVSDASATLPMLHPSTMLSLLAAVRERDALRAVVAVSACPDCGGMDYRLPYNGGPCRYVWHDRKETLAGRAAS